MAGKFSRLTLYLLKKILFVFKLEKMISDVFWRKQVITVYVISIAVAQTEKDLERLLI